MDDLTFDRPDDGVLRLTLNRPAVHNAITLDMQRGIAAHLRAAADDDSVRAVVLAGAGGTAFSAGYDITELTAPDSPDAAATIAERDELLWAYRCFPKPTVAAVGGLCCGAGTLYAACSDLRVGGPDTSIAVTAVRYGGAGLTWLLDDLIGSAHARDLLMSGRSVVGDDALRLGLITRFGDDVTATALAAATELAGHPPATLTAIKALADAGHRARFDAEAAANRELMTGRSMTDTFAGFLERREVSS